MLISFLQRKCAYNIAAIRGIINIIISNTIWNVGSGVSSSGGFVGISAIVIGQFGASHSILAIGWFIPVLRRLSVIFLELRSICLKFSIVSSNGSRIPFSSIRQSIFVIGNIFAPPLIICVGVIVEIGGVFVTVAPIIVGVLVFIDNAGGGRLGVLGGGTGVSVDVS